MRRVRTIHTLRNLSAPIAGSALLLIGSLYFIGREVWVARVWENMPHTLALKPIALFLESAFFGTTSLVQALTLLSLAAGILLLRSCMRLLAGRGMRYAFSDRHRLKRKAPSRGLSLLFVSD